MFDLGRGFLATVERRPHAVAISDGRTHKTYAQWYADIQSVAHHLRRLGLEKGDRLVISMHNRWQMATLYWACQFAGIIATPVNWRSTTLDIRYYLKNSGAKGIAHDDAAAEAVQACVEAHQVLRIVVGDVTPPGAIAFDSLLGRTGETLLMATPDDYSMMLYTSGTTGRPKGVPRRHRVERAATAAYVAQNLYRHDETMLGVMPLYHATGVRALQAMAMVDGRFVCIPKFEPEATLQAIERERVTSLNLVPTLYHMLLEAPGFAPHRVASIDKIGFAGAPMSAGLIARVEAAFQPSLFVNQYGCSELYALTVDQHANHKPGSSGRAALNQRLRVVKIGATSPEMCVSPGAEGEVIADMSGDEAFEGYWECPEADGKALRDGWYFTGDTGYFDDDGDLFVTGRVDDLINSGGENISPLEIENVLSLHPQVEEVAVVGLPDDKWGQVVTAFIKARSDVDERELGRYCLDAGLTRFKCPRGYRFIEELPKSPVGKVLRRMLRVPSTATPDVQGAPSRQADATMG
ncbi:4-chlorobenzoate--CoA ligase [Chromohalobacter japonicus]|uniref:4-chlorobenzoate--CoA ligase n=1 Tax=Chromohalobacter japonicus TaxID=223900 RepID=A0A1Q8TD66_9GAMM|nr:AMP-binding protein [Chromohalobacter japonicus]OLO11627.1 4-chlorobenzoate--CoA ligase [Chromohalobacter japonicus]